MSDEASTLARWHDVVQRRDPAALSALIADNAVFHSPVVHTPQVGKPLVMAYLGAALHVFPADSFRYVREVVGAHDAVLEFECTVNDIHINGVDMIRWGDDGRIVDFKVMIRPLKAITLIQQMMAQMLEKLRGSK